MRPEFRRLGDGYVMSMKAIATDIRIERLRRERGELVGELALLSSLPGAKSVDGVVHVANFNLSADRSRSDRAKVWAERLRAPDLDLAMLLEEFCQKVLASERVGEPAVMLRDVPLPEVGGFIDIDRGLSLLRRHPVIIFGDGGDAKSYLALYWAARMAARGMRVLYVDWEFAGEDHRERLGRITPDMPDLWYVRAERPLVHEVDRIARVVADHAIDYWVADSIVFACDGPPESAEVAGAYFRAVRRIGLGSLHVAHTTKGEGGDHKPFGSAFWHNGARSTWYIKRSEESSNDEIHVGLFNRKSSVGAKAAPIGYSIKFSPDRTAFSREEVADTPDLAAKLSVGVRIEALLRSEGPLKIHEIAEAIDALPDTVARTVRRGRDDRFVHLPGENGITLIGLAARGVA